MRKSYQEHCIYDQRISGGSAKNTRLSAILIYIQCLANQTNFLGGFMQNANSRLGRKLPKCYVKSIKFSSIARTNVGSFSMSFGCKIFSGSEDSSCQIFNIHFSLLKLTFLVLSNLKACNSKTIKNFGTKTH